MDAHCKSLLGLVGTQLLPLSSCHSAPATQLLPLSSCPSPRAAYLSPLTTYHSSLTTHHSPLTSRHSHLPLTTYSVSPYLSFFPSLSIIPPLTSLSSWVARLRSDGPGHTPKRLTASNRLERHQQGLHAPPRRPCARAATISVHNRSTRKQRA